MPFHWHTDGPAGSGVFCRIELYVIADEKIETAVAVVVEPGATRSPANFLIIETSLAGDIGECSVAVIVKQNIVSPEATEQIVIAVVVIVTDANAGLPAGSGQSGFLGYVGECAVTVVFVQMGGGSLSRRPTGRRAGFRW